MEVLEVSKQPVTEQCRAKRSKPGAPICSAYWEQPRSSLGAKFPPEMHLMVSKGAK